MAGYYRKFFNNISIIVEPLINLLSKRSSSGGPVAARMSLIT